MYSVTISISMVWVELTHVLAWVGNGLRIFVFSGLGRVMGLKWQICEKTECRVGLHNYVYGM